MKTKPFDLEKALAGAPVITRHGDYRVVEILCFKNKTDVDFPMQVMLEDDFCDHVKIDSYGLNGRNNNSADDLLMIEEE